MAGRPVAARRVVPEVVGVAVPLGGPAPRVTGAPAAFGGVPLVPVGRRSGGAAARRGILTGLGHPARLRVGDRRRVRAATWVPGRFTVPAVLPPRAFLAARAAVGPLGPAVGPGLAGRWPLVGPGGFGLRPAVGLVPVAARVGAVAAAVPGVRLLLRRRLVGPGAAQVRPVGPGRGERRHVDTAHDAGPAAGRRRVLHADVSRVALPGELRVPFVGRLDHPGRFGRILPPIGVSAAHPRCPSPDPGRVPAYRHRRLATAAG